MPRKRFGAEQIIPKLREAEVDLANALANLPAPCQHIVSASSDSGCHSRSSAGTDKRNNDRGSPDRTSCCKSSSGTKEQKKAPPDSGGASWRRGESNPRPVMLRR